MTDIDSALSDLRQAPDREAAWSVLVRRTWPFVLALSHRLLPRPHRLIDPQDIAQDVYFKFARYWRLRRPPIQESDSLLSLLAVMTRRLCEDVARRQGRARRDVGRDIPGTATDVPARSTESLDVEFRDLLDWVCLRLDPQARTILGLRLQGYKQAEIASRLGVSTRTIERRLLHLRLVLAPHFRLETDNAGRRIGT